MFSNMFRNKPGFPNGNKLAIRLMYVTDGWMCGLTGGLYSQLRSSDKIINMQKKERLIIQT
jgi:hypothetical protein